MLKLASRRYLQTVRPMPGMNAASLLHGSFPSSTSAAPAPNSEQASPNGWARHSLPKEFTKHPSQAQAKPQARPRFAGKPLSRPMAKPETASTSTESQPAKAAMEPVAKEIRSEPQPQPKEVASAAEKPAAKPRRKLRPRKAVITLSPKAVEHLRNLLDSPNPQMIRVGVRNRGCSGLTYNLEYVDKPGKFDEEVIQDGVKVLIDSKALFSIIGSEMDWIDDKLSSRFVFHNPNSKGQCGCGESFMV
uniref:Iron-sulfur assembly protein 1 n=1 Tax=Blastobotrys adeninivorans TaxID=409370 RepID=A0A060SYW8_BLAAD